MALRVTLICLVLTFIFVQLITANPRVVKRETTPEKDISKEVDDAIAAIKNNMELLMKNFSDNDMVKNLTTLAKSFGEEIVNQGNQLVNKIQQSSKTSD